MDNETRRKILEALVVFNNAMTDALGAQEVQVPRIEERQESSRGQSPKSVEPQGLSIEQRIIKAMGNRPYPIKAKTIARLAKTTEKTVQHKIQQMKKSGVPIFTIRAKGYVLGHKPARYTA